MKVGLVTRPLGDRAFAALAFGLPLALFAAHHRLGHEGDLTFFHQWYLAFREGGAFYRDGPGVNYPILGVLLVCGPARLLDLALGAPLSLEGFRLVHKLVLVGFEVGLIVAAARLLRTLGSPRPRGLALALYALPTTWAGGAWFGQTDVAGTVALLLAAAALLRFHRDGRSRALAEALAALLAALLLKQLTWFALPPLGLLLVAGLRRHGTPRRWAAALLTPALVSLPDPLLALPDGRWSHVHHVLARSAGDHGALLVANGASLWVLARDVGLDARAPLVAGLSAFAIGWIAWSLAQLAWVVRARRPEDLVRGAGLASLGMALLLTGVHERYLAHAVPLLFLSTRGASRALGAAVGLTGGLFVLASVHDALSPIARPEPVALLGLAWLLAVTREVGRGPRADPAPLTPAVVAEGSQDARRGAPAQR